MSRTARHQKTDAEILDVAWDLLSRDGAGASLAQIAAAAGISRQSVYLHFGSRAGLLMALVRRADSRFDIHSQLASAAALADPRARLQQVIAAWLGFVPQIYSVASDLIRLRDSDPDAAAAWDDRMEELKAWLLDVVQGLSRDGVLAPNWTATEARDYLWAGMSLQVWELLVMHSRWTQRQAVQRIQTALVAAVLRS